MAAQPHEEKDPGLAATGVSRIEWTLREMPVLRGLLQRFTQKRPLPGVRISGCLHVTTETANPAPVLDMRFANQVHPIPPELDQQMAGRKLTAMGLQIDRLSAEQQTRLASWE